NRGFGPNGYVVTLVASERHPAERHVPAMEVAIDAEAGHGNLLLFEIIPGVELYFPLRREAEVAMEVQRGCNTLLGSRVGILEAERTGKVPRDVEIDERIGV